MQRLFAAFLFLLTTANAAAEEALRIDGGWVVGGVEDGVRVWRGGIPYAAPPIGALRWREPARSRNDQGCSARA